MTVPKPPGTETTSHGVSGSVQDEALTPLARFSVLGRDVQIGEKVGTLAFVAGDLDGADLVSEVQELTQVVAEHEAEIERLNQTIEEWALCDATSAAVVEAAGRIVDHWMLPYMHQRSIGYTEAGVRARQMLIHAVRNHREATGNHGGESQ